MSYDEHTRPMGRLPRILAIAVLAGGSLLTIGGAAQAAEPAGPIKCANGDPYVVTVGGTDGCEAPIGQDEQQCYDGAAQTAPGTAAGGAVGGAVASGGPGAAPGAAGGAASGAVGGCINGAAK